MTGTVFAPDGKTAVANAAMYVPTDQTRAVPLRKARRRDAEPVIVETRTDARGNFVLTGVPAGDTVVNIAKGQ